MKGLVCILFIQAQEVPGVTVFRYEGAVMFASFDYFRDKLIEKSGFDPLKICKQMKHAALNSHEELQNKESNNAKKTTSSASIQQQKDIDVETQGSQQILSNIVNSQIGMNSEVLTTNEKESVAIAAELSKEIAENQFSPPLEEINAEAAAAPVNGVNQRLAVNLAVEGEMEALVNKKTQAKNQHIILDCSVWAFIDDTAVQRLIDVCLEIFHNCLVYTRNYLV